MDHAEAEKIHNALCHIADSLEGIHQIQKSIDDATHGIAQALHEWKDHGLNVNAEVKDAP